MKKILSVILVIACLGCGSIVTSYSQEEKTLFDVMVESYDKEERDAFIFNHEEFIYAGDEKLYSYFENIEAMQMVPLYDMLWTDQSGLNEAEDYYRVFLRDPDSGEIVLLLKDETGGETYANFREISRYSDSVALWKHSATITTVEGKTLLVKKAKYCNAFPFSYQFDGVRCETDDGIYYLWIDNKGTHTGTEAQFKLYIAGENQRLFSDKGENNNDNGCNNNHVWKYLAVAGVLAVIIGASFCWRWTRKKRNNTERTNTDE